MTESLTGGQLPAIGANGAWALFRLMDKAKFRNELSSSRLSVGYDIGGRGVLLEFSTQGSANPLNSRVLQSFSCPKAQALTLPNIGTVNVPIAPSNAPTSSPTSSSTNVPTNVAAPVNKTPELGGRPTGISAGPLPTNPKQVKP